MRAREYLSQAYRLEQRINSDIEEAAGLRRMAASISSPSWGEKYGGTRPTDPPFVRSLIKVMDLEDKINDEIELLVKLKAEIRVVIDQVKNIDEQIVLRYRYLHNYTWEQIARKLNAGERTVRRWHNSALEHVVVPEKPTII